MRKRRMDKQTEAPIPNREWLDVEQLATVEFSSEDPDFPIEGALVPGHDAGWRAAGPGEQIIRLSFDEPLSITLIQLLFIENNTERTQEFMLRWSRDSDGPMEEIVRQQYHFSPPTTTTEIEDYGLQLEGVRVLELSIIPDISGGQARAVLEELRLA
ncbi:MAG: hypothetical protein U5S82_01895 [Gammaproteobacteria bacterium]|nr:hypothetical protein [Gammaproteobacteria bacterium]